MPVTLLGPLRDKQPGKHNRVRLHQVGLGQKSPGCRSLKGPWGLAEAKVEREPSSDPGEENGEELPPHRGEGVLGDRRAQDGKTSVCVCVCVVSVRECVCEC